jgi:hypothetical protein
MSVTPNIAEHMSDEKRYVPLKSLIGPITVPIEMFQRRLQVGNQSLGDFAQYESNQMKRAISFNYKKLMDVFVRLFEDLFYQDDESKLKIEARYVHLLCRTTDREDHTAWIRDQVDLAASYEKIESFVFFVEVRRRENAEEEEEMELSDIDDIVEKTFVDIKGERKSSGDEQEAKRRKLVAIKLQASYNCQQALYNCTRDSLDLSAIFTNPVDFGRVIQAAVTPVTVALNRDSKSKLSELEYAPSKVFNTYKTYMASVEEGSGAPDRVPHEFVTYHDATRQHCLDLCAGLSFGLEPNQIRLELFRFLGFPDIRQVDQPDIVPYPDDATLLRAAGIELDNTVQVKGVSGFALARDKLNLSVRAMNEWCRVHIGDGIDAVRLYRSNWQKRGFIVYKSIVYGPRSAIGKSVKAMIRQWETETEKDRPCGRVGIEVKPLTLVVYPNLDAQQNYLANLYTFAEKAGVFCQHSNFIGMLIDSRYACRKGSGMKHPPPHTILYGSPGSGKSYCLEMTKWCTQGDSGPGFCKWVDNSSPLNWAVVSEEDPDNPDTSQTQIAILWDEVPASKLGAGDSRKGEGSDMVSQTKTMCTKATLEFERNAEIKRADGTTGRGLEEASITNECVFLGGMNRPPIEVNPAFHRRFCFKAALAFERADRVTLEDAKSRSDLQDPDTDMWVAALRCNAQLHLVVAGAEYAGIIKPPCLRSFDALSAAFEREVRTITTVNHFPDRLNNARERLRLFTRMIAIFETYQRNGQQVHKFDHLVTMLPEVERRSVAGERLALAMLSSLEDSVFPLMHKIVLQSIKQRWGGGEGIHQHRIDGFRDHSPGRYAKLTLEKRGSYRQKKDETMVECGVRVLLDHIERIIGKAAGAYRLEGAAELAKAAIVELTKIEDPDHPVIVFDEDVDGMGDAGGFSNAGELAVYVSIPRLDSVETTLADIVKKLAKTGTQLTMIPHRVAGSTAILPQFPVAIENGDAPGELIDDTMFAARCAETFYAPDDALHPSKPQTATTADSFPSALIARVLV